MKRILVIEDNDSLREEIAVVLEIEGYTVATAENGRIGLERIKEVGPDLVICDLMMPEMDGFETLKAIRADPEIEALPVIILTAREERQDMRRGMELGADDYIMKPFKIGDLLRGVNAAFEKHARVERHSEAKLEQLREHVAQILPHELRTPLALIMGYAEMLADSNAAVPQQDVASLAQQILGAGQRLNRMSENALLYIQLELLRNGRGDVATQGIRTPTRVSDVVSVHARAKAAAYGRDADLVLDLKESSTSVNRAYVEKIVDELVDNALKFSRPHTQIRISTASEGAAAVLRVSDSGQGMTADQIAGIGGFVQFERSVREQQGLGLGLSIVKGVATIWGGTMTIESTVGAGTTVTLSLPLPSVAAASSRRAPGPNAT